MPSMLLILDAIATPIITEVRSSPSCYKRDVLGIDHDLIEDRGLPPTDKMTVDP